MNRLILVAGHAIPRNFDALGTDVGWYLKPFQSGEGPKYLEHIRRGVDLAAEEKDSLLVFSGGQTEFSAGPLSEGQGYWLIAESYGWYGHEDVRSRSTTEEFSRDSFENLLFGICRFREYVGEYPQHVTAVGWRFKSERFRIHAAAIGLQDSQFSYQGVNNPDNAAAAESSEALCLEMFRKDPYGLGEEASTKRISRNPFRRQHGYAITCPEFSELLRS